MLARKLKKKLEPRKVLIIDMDAYVIPEKDIPKINGLSNWEVPESYDFERILETIEKNPDCDAIIIEGIRAFASIELNNLYDLTVIMKITKSTYLNRRKEETRWGNEPDWYLEYVWEAHQKYGVIADADFVLSGEKEITENELSDIVDKARLQ